MMLPHKCLRDSKDKTKPNSGKNTSYTHTKGTLNVYINNINDNSSFPFSLAPVYLHKICLKEGIHKIESHSSKQEFLGLPVFKVC